ncbi:MAG TPA: DUF445 family protein [Ramlibacter sp.]|uniref:DUF445 domain-containing protein n=1 Tax=Ramlibacter sp. TaxID=1917967 RepID=UPI002D7EC4A4|nr:DUF445 family protein [Ramlibacter sp.]HET8744732.1 DUF445 family protein [Ramlibacter sp.]
MQSSTLVALAALAGIAGLLLAVALRARRPAADKHTQLAHAKTDALLLLGVMGCVLVLSLSLPPGLFANALRSTSEAAIVGGLADWFAVSALFRPLPVPVIGRDTDVIARKKDEIGDNLAQFVQEKFLDADSLAALLRRHDLAGGLAGWLTQEANTRRLGGFIVKLVAGSLHLVEAERVQQLLKDAARTLLARADLSRSASEVLDTLTANGRHQQLLDQLIERLLRLLAAQPTRDAIAAEIVEWLKTEHYRKQLVLPTEWLGEKGSELAARQLGRWLDEVRNDPRHRLRTAFDAQVEQWIARLKADPVMRAKAEEIKAYLLNDDDLGRYAAQLWRTVSAWLHRNVESEDSDLRRNLMAAGGWLGRELAADPELRRTLNEQLEAAARSAAPDFSAYLTGHIRDTVRQWDAREMASQVELSIGPQLQKIRVNGTLVGGAIGLVLFALGETARRWSG